MKILNVSLFVVLSDQITKLMVKGIDIPTLGIHLQGLRLGSTRPIFGNFLRITYIENPGMAFGIDFGGKMFFSVFSIIASLGILLYLYKARNENLLFRIALALILGGAVGNLIDRVFYGVLFNDGGLFYGKVVDFIDADFFDVNLFGYHMTRWPVFNIADASVTCGVLLMLFSHRRSAHEPATIGVDGALPSTVIGGSPIPADPPPTSGSQPPQS
ncbi:MAG TPA: signal peptidase II [Bacteroidota bacterium]|nr:signal peptidase II [Bacteroidota bacterium]